MRVRGFEFVKPELRKTLGKITLPTRGSKYSAGYDLYSPISVIIFPGKTQFIWTDIKAYMQDDEVLLTHIRSSIAIKKGLTLANFTGIIDKDYYSNIKNDGNIGVCLRNNTDEPVGIDEGERVAQAIFTKYLISDNGNVDDKREGGIGSTDD